MIYIYHVPLTIIYYHITEDVVAQVLVSEDVYDGETRATLCLALVWIILQ